MNFQKSFISTKPTLSTQQTRGTATTASLRDATGVNVPTDPAGFPNTGIMFGPAICPIVMPPGTAATLPPIVPDLQPIAPPLQPPPLVQPICPPIDPTTNLPYTQPTIPTSPPFPQSPPLPPNPSVPTIPLPTVPLPTLPNVPIVPNAPTFATLPFPQTPPIFLEEFYNQLRFLNEFFMTHGKKYWITGGTLLGQVRCQKILPWDTNNDVGVLIANEAEGELLFQAIRAHITMYTLSHKFAIWRSTHGLKLISKQLAHAATDIYFYRIDGEKAVFLRSRSQTQWPKDYFKLTEIDDHVVQVPFGPLFVLAPNDPIRYLKTFYGPNALTHARLGTFDHFSNGPRIGPKNAFPLQMASNMFV